MHDIAASLSAIHHRIADACRRASRAPASVQLVAVSKTFSPQTLAAAAGAGQQAFGESYAQEFLRKRHSVEMLTGHPLHWHFIGPVQGNKSAILARECDWVHTIERLKVAERLSALRGADLPALNICVQVNISGETAKSGCAPAEALALCESVAALPNLRLRGLMAVPAPAADPRAGRDAFTKLRRLSDQIRAAGIAQAFDTLSMGMSQDFEIAIEEGATIVRIGSAIFGERGADGT